MPRPVGGLPHRGRTGLLSRSTEESQRSQFENDGKRYDPAAGDAERKIKKPRKASLSALREAPLCGTGRDAVSLQSRIQMQPHTRQSWKSRKESGHLLFLALTGFQAAVTELQMQKRLWSNCGGRHIVAAIWVPGACGSPA